MSQDMGCFYQHERGRWLCPSGSDANLCVSNYPGEYVYTYERDKNGKLINIELYYDPHRVEPKPPVIRGGRFRGVKPSKF